MRVQSRANATWGEPGPRRFARGRVQFLRYLAYKAERAGGRLIRVRPHNTSNLCSCCKALTPSTIGDDFCCAYCGHTMDRDHNAAVNILGRGIVTPVTAAA